MGKKPPISRVVIISYYSGSEQNPRVFRAEFLAHYFSECAGLETHVFVSAPRGEDGPETGSGKLTVHRVSSDRVNIHTLYLAPSKGLAANSKRFLKDFFFLTKEKRFLKQILNHIREHNLERLFGPQTAIITVALPFVCSMIGHELRSRFSAACWVADSGDPFTYNQYHMFSPVKLFVERRTYRNVDFVTIPSSIAVSSYRKVGIPGEKLRVIPQAYRETQKPSAYVDVLDPVKINIFYAGIFYPGLRDPTPFFRAVARASNPDVIFHFFGNTRECDDLLGAAGIDNRSNFRLNSVVPRDELLFIMKHMDYVLNISNTSSNQFPSKVIEYFFSGRPILNLIAGPANAIEKAFNVQNTQEAIETALKGLIKHPPDMEYIQKSEYEEKRIGSLFLECLKKDTP
jgi:hypothetical protein